jgi:hypothetical protein
MRERSPAMHQCCWGRLSTVSVDAGLTSAMIEEEHPAVLSVLRER